MKKITLIAAMLLTVSAFAQTPKFGRLDLQEVIFLMDKMDTANAILQKYQAELQETSASMQKEYVTKVNNYQQMAANWTPAVLQAKQQEIAEMEQRMQTFSENAQQELMQKQEELYRPLFQEANDAVAKVGKEGGYTFIFSTSTNVIAYYNEAQCIDVTDAVKKALNIPLDKVLKQQPVASAAE